MQFANFYTPPALASKIAKETATVARLVGEALPEHLRHDVRTQHHRAVLGASLCAKFPALASNVCALIDRDQGADALDTVEAGLIDLYAADEFLFRPVPSRDEMLKLAIQWRGGTVSESQRASLWVSHCDRAEHDRFLDAYRFNREIAERGEALKNARTGPTKTQDVLAHTSARIDGGGLSQGDDLQFATYELPGKIGGVA